MRPLTRVSFLAVVCLLFLVRAASGQWNPNYTIGTSSGKVSFAYNQTPDNLVEVSPPLASGVSLGITSEWESSASPAGPFASITQVSGDQPTYVFSGPLTQTMYFRRRVMLTGAGNTIYSNTIKLEAVSVNWEDINYTRTHVILVPGITNWETVDQLPVGQKLQSTEYADGMNRTMEVVSRQTATPSQTGGAWGDIVQFSNYDAYGRMTQDNLPYTTTNASGLYKASPVSDQQQYYSTAYNETSPFSATTFDNSPLDRPETVRFPGASWNASSGIKLYYGLNDSTDNVQIFNIGYNSGDIPISAGAYAAGTLSKLTRTDEQGRQTVEYTDKTGHVILRKVQVAASPSAAHSGWSCTYSVYDDFGLLRYRIQPDGVDWLDQNGWTFGATNGTTVLAEYCFHYEYDAKGRMILKKAPGADELDMVYDARDRLVFTQDGNQRHKTPAEWMATFYDDLDRVVETGLYETTETSASLQNDVNNAMTSTTVTQTTPNPNYPANLVETTRVAGISSYIASVSVVLQPGFSSSQNDNFVVQIAPGVPVSATATMMAYSNPVSSSALNDPNQFTPLKYNYYDDYSFASVKAFDNGYNNGLAYSTSDPTVLPIATDARTTNQLTGSKVRVLGTSTFLNSTYYYDEKGRQIQALVDNYMGATDIVTRQYHFDGRLLSSDERHTASGTPYTNFDILSKNVFDQIGRPVSLQLKVGTNNFKTVANYDLDDMGRPKAKHFDPGYTGTNGTELESLNYTYNLQNRLTGINKDYALKTAGLYNKWGHFFGIYLGYDNRDGVFAASQLDGGITGVVWSTQGDDVQRKYDYTYDNVGRLTGALYGERQNLTGNYSNGTMDFSVTGSTGTGPIQYDLNGNLLAMAQKGVLPGNSTPVLVDDLHYNYVTLSNKLLGISDAATSGSANGQLGDFSKGSNTTNNDYQFDHDGNLIIDNNKSMTTVNGLSQGVVYNHLDKPVAAHITGKGTINFVYDADGNKLQKIFTPDGGGIAITTSYAGRYVYVGSNLQYINFEEGRIRVVQAVTSPANAIDILNIDGNIDLPGGMRGAYDYFVKDQLGSVRMILTEESHLGSNTCTMEPGRDLNEAPLFGQVDANGNPTSSNEVRERVSVNNIPGQTTGGGWTNTTIGSWVSQLGNLAGAGHQIGPNTLLKVMAGDQVTAQVVYYYPDPVINSGGGASFISDIATSLMAAIGGSSLTSALEHTSASSIVAPLNVTGSPFSTVANPDANSSLGNAPKAYLAVMFFDERFNFVGTGSMTSRVSQSGNGAQPLVIPATAPKNGYAYVYVCNESDESVYFDNLQVANQHGAILEEDHYYAYGLKIASISSKLLADPHEGFVTNKDLYNGKEIVDEADLDWYEYGYRNYDPQIGRFVQLDPMAANFPEMTPFQYASNDPISNIDLDGLEGVDPMLLAQVDNIIYDQLRFIQTPLMTEAVVHPTMDQLGNFIGKVMPKVQVTAHLALILGRGGADALLHANSLGLYWNADHSEEYSDPGEKMIYIWGEVGGTTLAEDQGADEIASGGTTAVEGLATGPGALFVSGGGALVALHGTGVAVVARIDYAKELAALVRLYMAYQKVPKMSATKQGSSGSSGSDPVNGETDATKLGKEAHRDYQPGKGFITDQGQNRLKSRLRPDGINRKQKIVSDLKPENPAKYNQYVEQVTEYARELQAKYGGKWKIRIDTYKINPDGTPVRDATGKIKTFIGKLQNIK